MLRSGVEVEVLVELKVLRSNLDLTLVVVSTFTGGWSEYWRVMLNSTEDHIKLKLKFELSLAILTIYLKLYYS